MRGKTPPQPAVPLRRLDSNAMSWLVCGYLLLIVAGYVLLRDPGVAPRSNEFKHGQAFFMAADAATLTGFQLQRPPFREQSLQGPLVLLALTIAGSLVSLVVGGIAVVRILKLPYSDGRVILTALAWVGSSLLIGTVFLTDRSGSLNIETLLDCWQRSASAFANSGVCIGQPPGPASWQTQVVMLPLAVLGGLGLPVLMELGDALRARRPLSRHSTVVLVMTAAVYLVAVVWFGVLRWAAGSGGWEAMASSSAVAINARTAGLPLENLDDLPRIMRWLIVPLMIVGAGSGGTAGGLKLTTLAHLFTGVRRSLRGETTGRPFAIAATWAGIYGLVVVVAFLSLLQVTGGRLPADRLLFDSISAVSNVGLSPGPVTLVGAELFILGSAMVVGRLAPLMILWWMAETTQDAEMAVG